MTARRHFTLFGKRLPSPRTGEDAIRTVLSVWSWSALAVTAVGGFAIQVPLFLLTWSDKTRKVPGRFTRDIAVTIAKLNPMWDFEIHGALPDYEPGKTVVVSNHVSNSDAFLISHLPWEMKWLGKASLFNIPFVGWLMRLGGDVPVKRGAKGSIVEAMQICREHLERGMPVMIFPEGTRSKSGELLPFKDGAFRLAIEAGADVLPLAVAGTRDALPKHSWKFGFANGLVKVGTPIVTRGLSLDDIETVKTQAREQIEAMVAEIEPLTASHG